MTFQPDILISWDISKKDGAAIVVSLLEYDPNQKMVVANVLHSVYAGEEDAGVISTNQLLAKHHLYKSNKLKEEAEKAFASIKGLREMEEMIREKEALKQEDKQ